jgi:hypothetical protein
MRPAWIPRKVTILRQSRRLYGCWPLKGAFSHPVESKSNRKSKDAEKQNLGILPELSNFYGLPGRAGGFPKGLRRPFTIPTGMLCWIQVCDSQINPLQTSKSGIEHLAISHYGLERVSRSSPVSIQASLYRCCSADRRWRIPASPILINCLYLSAASQPIW